MTTIATDGKSMAGDGLVTSEGTIFGHECVKVERLADGRIAGACGSAYFFQPFVVWLANGGDFPEFDGQFEALVLSPDGSVSSFDDKGRSIKEEIPTASGSGRQIALGAMLAGKSPKEAVEIACLRDTGTGGKIIAISLE